MVDCLRVGDDTSGSCRHLAAVPDRTAIWSDRRISDHLRLGSIGQIDQPALPGLQRGGCTAVLGSAPGGEFYQTFQLIISYLWRVERGWNLTEYFDKVSLP